MFRINNQPRIYPHQRDVIWARLVLQKLLRSISMPDEVHQVGNIFKATVAMSISQANNDDRL
ncbi:MAG: hypothetical protein AAF892_06855 [Cyanobacteria bacterium P01_D01_bin.71]